jgi:hypothetical protein
MRKYRSFIVGSANASYPILCCRSQSAPLWEESATTGVPERPSERVRSTKATLDLPVCKSTDRAEAIDVGERLKGIGLGQYEATFRAHDIDVDVLPDVTEADLGKIGLRLGRASA